MRSIIAHAMRGKPGVREVLRGKPAVRKELATIPQKSIPPLNAQQAGSYEEHFVAKLDRVRRQLAPVLKETCLEPFRSPPGRFRYKVSLASRIVLRRVLIERDELHSLNAGKLRGVAGSGGQCRVFHD
jgi:hypothetical protein